MFTNPAVRVPKKTWGTTNRSFSIGGKEETQQVTIHHS